MPRDASRCLPTSPYIRRPCCVIGRVWLMCLSLPSLTSNSYRVCSRCGSLVPDDSVHIVPYAARCHLAPLHRTGEPGCRHSLPLTQVLSPAWR